jgi:hypothetical protein
LALLRQGFYAEPILCNNTNTLGCSWRVPSKRILVQRLVHWFFGLYRRPCTVRASGFDLIPSVRTKLVARPLTKKGAAPEKGCAFFVLVFLNVQAPLIVLKRRVVESGISAFPL